MKIYYIDMQFNNGKMLLKLQRGNSQRMETKKHTVGQSVSFRFLIEVNYRNRTTASEPGKI